jgi:membrane-bound lytic murein transglycosylase B
LVYLCAKKNCVASHNQKEEIIISPIRFGKPQAAIILIAVFIAVLVQSSPLLAANSLFASLEKRLIDDGVNADLVRAVYRNPAVKLVTGTMAGNITRSEKTLNYQQFLTDATVAKARHYLNKHRRVLENAYRQFGVPTSIITAILMVETRLGTYTGKHLTVNVLSTMAVANDPKVQKQIFSNLITDRNDKESHKNAMKRLQARAGRGYRELKACLEYVHTNGKDPFTLRGSSEGAIGICQFLPSNISQYGRDGNGDGIVDLDNHADAIASAASYLHAHHWKKAKTEKEKKKVLMRYNHSVYYVDTVYALALRLRWPGQ